THMGLDQYAYSATSENNKDMIKIAEWRKHPNLQGWMENLYREKGGEKEFNCVHVELDKDDLDALETAVNEESLPETQGFFFGNNSDEYYKNQDLEFIKNARAAIGEGKKVFYGSWW